MPNKVSSDPFEPFDFDARSRELEQHDVFNRLVDEERPGNLAREIERLANAGDPGIIAVLEEAGVNDPRLPRTFYLSDGREAKIFADAEGWHAVLETEGQYLTFTSPDRDGAMSAASRYVEKTREPRELAPNESLQIARMAQAGQIKEALITYLRYRLGNADLDGPDADMRYRHVYDQAAWDVWRFYKDTYVPDENFEQLVGQIASEKPLTFRLIEALHKDYVKTKPGQSARQVAREIPETEQPTEADLERLSDAELAKLRTGALQERGRRVREFDSQMGIR